MQIQLEEVAEVVVEDVREEPVAEDGNFEVMVP